MIPVGYVPWEEPYHLCPDCAAAAAREQGVGLEDTNEFGQDYFYPVFSTDEFDSFPVCDVCGEEITDVNLTTDGYEYELQYHPELRQLYGMDD